MVSTAVTEREIVWLFVGGGAVALAAKGDWRKWLHRSNSRGMGTAGSDALLTFPPRTATEQSHQDIFAMKADEALCRDASAQSAVFPLR
jgi:hypothetical protein